MDTDKLLVSTEELQELLSCGRRYAEKIGSLACGEVRIGRLKRWNVSLLKSYLEKIAM